MAVTRRPKGKTPASEAQIAALIDKGGSTPQQAAAVPAAQSMSVSLRIPGALAERLDSALQGKLIRVPRHTWILEAIVEKLDRETQGESSTAGA